jgi:hypothetical protein
VTIDVALLRQLAAQPNTSLVAYGPVVLLKPTTVAELLDAYEELHRYDADMEAGGDWLPLHLREAVAGIDPEQRAVVTEWYWRTNLLIGGLQTERDRLRAFWDEMRAFRDWANVQFPNSTPQSKAHHLAKEAHELANNPSDPEEMADVLGLFAHLADWDGVDLAGALRAKRLINQSRQWGTPDENGVIEHLRDAKRER